jgi:hypothetical protein
MTGFDSCFTYASTAFRTDPEGPRATIFSGQICPPPAEFTRWFDPKESMAVGTDLDTGDLLIWSAKRHVAVATGDDDWVVQYGYKVKDRAAAQELKGLIQQYRAGKLPGAALEKYDGYLTGMCRNKVSLEDLRLALSGYGGDVVDLYRLKQSARVFLDTNSGALREHSVAVTK